jgi:hypothetical protein
MNRETSALMKTRIRPTVVRLARACLLVLFTATVGAQRNEVLPDPRVDPATGQFLQAEPPVQLDFNRDLRVEVDFERLVLVDIVKYLRELPDFSEVNFVLSPRFVESPHELAITLKLRSANLRDILTALGVATDGQVWFEVLTPTLVALVPNPAAGPAKTAPPPAHQVVNLREMLQVRESAILNEAINTINQLVRQTLNTIHGNYGFAPTLNFHQSSGVLVIVGQPDAIRITTDIIQHLRPHYRQPRETQPQPESGGE